MKIFTTTLLVSLVSVFSMQVSAAPAFVVKDADCNGFIPNPDTDTGFPAIGGLYTTQTQGVNAGKVGKLTCHFDFDNDTVGLTSASSARGWVCAFSDPVTGDPISTEKTLMLATPDGKALMRCTFSQTKGKPQP